MKQIQHTNVKHVQFWDESFFYGKWASVIAILLLAYNFFDNIRVIYNFPPRHNKIPSFFFRLSIRSAQRVIKLLATVEPIAISIVTKAQMTICQYAKVTHDSRRAGTNGIVLLSFCRRASGSFASVTAAAFVRPLPSLWITVKRPHLSASPFMKNCHTLCLWIILQITLDPLTALKKKKKTDENRNKDIVVVL